jgi:hypothetical protein
LQSTLFESFIRFRIARYNITDEQLNGARQAYLRVAGPAGDKKDRLTKTGLAGCVAAFSAAYCANVEVSLVVMLQAMVIWGGYSPDGLFLYKIGTSMDQFQAASYVLSVLNAYFMHNGFPLLAMLLS